MLAWLGSNVPRCGYGLNKFVPGGNSASVGPGKAGKAHRQLYRSVVKGAIIGLCSQQNGAGASGITELGIPRQPYVMHGIAREWLTPCDFDVGYTLLVCVMHIFIVIKCNFALSCAVTACIKVTFFKNYHDLIACQTRQNTAGTSILRPGSGI